MKRIASLVILIVLALLGVGLATRLMADLQWQEMASLLTQASSNNTSLEAASLWARLELAKRRLQDGETRVENYRLEARIQALAAARPKLLDSETQNYQGLITGLRRLSGRDGLIVPERNAIFQSLEKAYIDETTKRYREAAQAYAKILDDERDLPQLLRARIQIHESFCLALAGEAEQASELCDLVAESQSGSDEAALARAFRVFLASLRTAEAANPATGAAAVRQAYLSLDYRQALARFAQLTDQDQPEARYYKARSHEELGQSTEALAEYRRVLFLDPKGPWGLETRRRLVMIEKVYAQSSALTRQALKDLEARGDAAFIQSLSAYPQLPAPSASALPEPENAELYLTTQPSGADLFLNGVLVGRSPLFVTDIPLGRVELSARLGKRQATLKRELASAAIVHLDLQLPVVYGGLKIKSPHRISGLILDGEVLADPTRILPGSHELSVDVRKANGELVLVERSIEIAEGETTVVELP